MHGLRERGYRKGAMNHGGKTVLRWFIHMRWRLRDMKGQGTTEYAILVGVLVVIAIIAITVFRPKLQELWDAIATGINGL